MKLGVLVFSLIMVFVVVNATNIKQDSVNEQYNDSQQVQFHNECNSSVDFYVKGAGGTTKYTVAAKSSKNVGVSVGDKILDSSRNEIIVIASSTEKVVVCE